MAKAIRILGQEAIAKRGWLAVHKWLIARRITQASILLLFMVGSWTGFYILKGTLSSSLLLETIPMTDPLLFLQMLAAGFTGIANTAIIGTAIILTGYLIVGGRVYCSWVCPVNMVTDLAWWTRRKLRIKTKVAMKRSFKYWMLALVLIVAFVSGTLAYELVNPVSILHRGIIFGMTTGWVLIAAIFAFDVFVMKQGWCGHICPMGTFYGLVGHYSPLRVHATARAKCDDCMDCFEVCPEPQVIPPALKGEKAGRSPIISTGDCTNCGRCIDICHADVFHYGFSISRPTGLSLGEPSHPPPSSRQ